MGEIEGWEKILWAREKHEFKYMITVLKIIIKNIITGKNRPRLRTSIGWFLLISGGFALSFFIPTENSFVKFLGGLLVGSAVLDAYYYMKYTMNF